MSDEIPWAELFGVYRLKNADPAIPEESRAALVNEKDEFSQDPSAEPEVENTETDFGSVAGILGGPTAQRLKLQERPENDELSR